METFQHETVLLQSVVSYLQPERGGLFVDATVGGGGHAEAILEKMEQSGVDGGLIGIDRDPRALQAAAGRLKRFGNRVLLVPGNFREIHTLLAGETVRQWIKSAGPVSHVAEGDVRIINGIVFDLGVSSHQLDESERGFTYHGEAPLDMRMGPDAKRTAAQILAEEDVDQLSRIITEYGEEKWASRIAKFIVDARQKSKIETADQLVDIIKAAIPAGARRRGPHPARRTFQALRIAVNDELGAAREGVERAIDHLAPGGRIAVISFHSLEDRVVKQTFAELSRTCHCPPHLPVCRCDGEAKVKVLTRKPVLPGERETANNPRARSAKLRVAESVLGEKGKE